MKFNVISLIIFLSFFYPVLKGFLFKNSTSALKDTINSIISSISLVCSIFTSAYFLEKIFLMNREGQLDKFYGYVPQGFINFCDSNPLIIRWILAIILIIIIQSILMLILNFLSRLTLMPCLDSIDKELKNRSNIIRRVFGALFQFPKGVCYAVLICFLLTFAATVNGNKNYTDTLYDSKIYTYLCDNIVEPITNSEVVKSIPKVLNNSFKIISKGDGNKVNLEYYMGNNPLVYYNGVTLNEGVKSNDIINNFALNLTKNCNEDYKKAEKIYTWIGKNIIYDDHKAEKIVNNVTEIKSGAIQAFNTGKGVCFDYACLFVAMCRANDISVRMVIGEGFNGEEWVNHSWNQFYDEGKSQWINVDPTFYSGGNYFNNESFSKDHRNSKVVGEW